MHATKASFRSLAAVTAAALLLSTPCANAGDVHLERSVQDLGSLYGSTAIADLAVGDLSGDGRPDLLVVPSGAIFVGQAGGSFILSEILGGPALPGSGHARIGELDGGGGPDIVIAGQGLAVWLAHAPGAGPDWSWSSAFTYFEDLVLADTNGDGHADLVGCDRWFAPTSGPSSLRLFIGAGDGSFAMTAVIEHGNGSVYSPYPKRLATGDVDGDGLDDVILAVQGYTADPPITKTCTLWTYAGRPDGTLDAVGTIALPWSQIHFDDPTSLECLDLDGDGLLDLVASNRGASTVAVLRGTGGGGFAVEETHGTGAEPVRMVLGDLDGDGHVDMATVGCASYNVTTLTGDGSGSFSAGYAAPVESVNSPGRALAAADVDLDGDVDLLAATGGGAATGKLTLLRNATPGPWTNEGLALSGTAGRKPLLSGMGPLVAGSSNSLYLSNGLSWWSNNLGTTTHLLVGLSLLAAPFKGGVAGPHSDLLVFGLNTSGTGLPGTGGAGNLSLDFTWPAGIPSGTTLWAQHWVVDPGGPAGFAASNTLRLQAP